MPVVEHPNPRAVTIAPGPQVVPPNGDPNHGFHRVVWRTVNGERVVEWAHAILVRGQLNRGTATTGDTRRHVRVFGRAVEDAAGPADDAGHILGLRLGGRRDLP